MTAQQSQQVQTWLDADPDNKRCYLNFMDELYTVFAAMRWEWWNGRPSYDQLRTATRELLGMVLETMSEGRECHARARSGRIAVAAFVWSSGRTYVEFYIHP